MLSTRNNYRLREKMSSLDEGGYQVYESESDYDPFGAAHSSTSISAARFTVAKDMD